MSALVAAFQAQALSCANLGSPFMERLMQALAEVWPGLGTPLAAKMAGFTGDLGPRGLSLPLRLGAGLHALVLAGRVPDLAAAYPPDEGAGLMAAVRATIVAHDSFLSDWIERPPQTNETGRSAVLIAAAAEVLARYGLPLQLSELGASAGLNLMFDRYALRIGDRVWGATGTPLVLTPVWSGLLPPEVPITVVGRSGVDLSPADPTRDGQRLLAYVWPDQPARLARLSAALALAVSGVEARVEPGDAADWLEARFAQPMPGACHMVYHTVAYQYFTALSQARIQRAVQAAAERATASAPLALVGMEADSGGRGAGITLRCWPGDVTMSLGRAGFHGQWVDWAPQE